jgi:hypothetical protein
MRISYHIKSKLKSFKLWVVSLTFAVPTFELTTCDLQEENKKTNNS